MKLYNKTKIIDNHSAFNDKLKYASNKIRHMREQILFSNVFFLLFFLLFYSGPSLAIDIFNEDQMKKITPYRIESNSTAGRYPIPTAGRSWVIIRKSIQKNNMNLKVGYLQLASIENSEYFSGINLLVNLEDYTSGSGYLSDLCAPNSPALYKKTLQRTDVSDDCMTLDIVESNIKGKRTTILRIIVRNAKSGGRLYHLEFFANLSKFNFPGTSKSEWSASEIDRNPKKKELIEKFTAWGSDIQARVGLAIAYGNKKDVFEGLESIDEIRSYISKSKKQTDSNQNSKLKLTEPNEKRLSLSLHWPDNNESIVGHITSREAETFGSAEITFSDSRGLCSGIFDLEKNKKTLWSINCENSINGFGSLAYHTDTHTWAGEGADTKGEKIRILIHNN